MNKRKRKRLIQKKISPHWEKILSKYISRNRKYLALKLLDNVIVNSLPLFANTPVFLEERRVALLLRIELLIEWNRELEALAWLCLECELNPNNKLAFLLKDQLIHELNLSGLAENKKELFNKLDYTSDTEWKEVTGMRAIKTRLMNEVIKPFKYPVLYGAYQISLPNGILFYGPPG